LLFSTSDVIVIVTSVFKTVVFFTLIISGTGKATNLQFCAHILSIDRNKNPLQISGKVPVG